MQEQALLRLYHAELIAARPALEASYRCERPFSDAVFLIENDHLPRQARDRHSKCRQNPSHLAFAQLGAADVRLESHARSRHDLQTRVLGTPTETFLFLRHFILEVV